MTSRLLDKILIYNTVPQQNNYLYVPFEINLYCTCTMHSVCLLAMPMQKLSFARKLIDPILFSSHLSSSSVFGPTKALYLSLDQTRILPFSLLRYYCCSARYFSSISSAHAHRQASASSASPIPPAHENLIFLS